LLEARIAAVGHPSQDDLIHRLTLVLAAARAPITLKEIQNRLDYFGYKAELAEIALALEGGPFANDGKGWELLQDDSDDAEAGA